MQKSKFIFRITFDDRFKVTSVPFFISDFNLLSFEIDNFTFKVLYLVTFYQYYIKKKENHIIFTVSFEKSKTVSFASLIMEKNVTPSALI